MAAARRTVLVTGVSRHLGGRVAAALAEQDEVGTVLGVDVVPPPHDIGAAEFVRADIRNPVVGRVVRDAGVDTVVHMSVLVTPRSAGGRAPMKEINVIGTMQLLAACHKAPSVRRLVVKSTAGVYGAGPRNPSIVSEETEPVHPPRSGWAKDTLEVEGYVRGFSRRRPDVAVAVLRFANIVGPVVDTPVTRLFCLPALPVPLGHDGRLQFCHEDDCVGATVTAALGRARGTFNVAGDGVLTSQQAAALAGRLVVGVPGPLVNQVGQWLSRVGGVEADREDYRLLAHGRVLDTRRLREELGYHPTATTREAFLAMVRERDLHGPATVVSQGLGRFAAHLRPPQRTWPGTSPQPGRPESSPPVASSTGGGR